MNKENLKKEIWKIIRERENMGMTNPCYTEKGAFEERIELIKELEKKYNCKIDVWNNITFLEV